MMTCQAENCLNTRIILPYLFNQLSRKYIVLPALALYFFQSTFCQTTNDNKVFAALFNEYTEDTYKLFAVTATLNGDMRYNHLLPVDFTYSYSGQLSKFYNRYLNRIKQF